MTASLGYVLAATMEKGLEERKIFGVQNPGQCADSAIEFLDKTENSSIAELDKVTVLLKHARNDLLTLLQRATFRAVQARSLFWFH